MGPLVYLTFSSMRNRFRVRIRRLREPRYLIGLIVGLGYFYLVFWQRGTSGRAGPVGALSAMSGARALIELFGAAALFVIAALAWIWPGRTRPALAFTRADVQFLFPAPFTRRQLIRYKVLRSQLGALIGSAIMTLFLRPGSLATGWTFFLGIAMVMAIINLHLTGVSLSRESLGAHGLAGLARQWLPLAAVVGAIGVLIAAVTVDWPVLSSLSGREMLGELERVASTGAASIVLWPFRAIVRLPLAQSPSAFAAALPPVLAIGLLNYAWVLRSDAAFEEASAELAEKVARVRKGPQPTAPRSKSLATPFTLALDGRAETAILWKNLILVGRYVSLKTLVRFIPLVVVFTIMFTRGESRTPAGELIGIFCTSVFAMTLLMGPQIARNDLRQDLVNLAVLRSWPVRGATLVRGEMLAPAAILTSIAWLCTIGALVVAARLKFSASYVVGAMFVAPGVILVQLVVQNAIAVMWPSWVVATGNRQSRGIDVMGQRMIMMFGLLLVLALAVLPAAVAFGAVFFPLYWSTSQPFIVLPSIAAAIVLLIEAFLGSEAVGKMLDRTDVGQIDATEN